MLQLVEICYNAPQYPCPFCLGRIDQKALAYELMTDEERKWRQEAAKAAEAQGIGRRAILGRRAATGAYSRVSDEPRRQHGRRIRAESADRFGAASTPTVPVRCWLGEAWRRPSHREAERGLFMRETTGQNDQARADRSVSRPLHWPEPEFIEV